MAKFNTLVLSLCKAHDAMLSTVEQARATDEVRRALRTKDPRSTLRDLLTPLVAQHYKLQTKEGQRGLSFVDDTDNRAKSKRSWLIAQLMGDKAKDKAGIKVPAEVLKAAQHLVTLCQKYEKARALASAAVGEAFNA